MSYITECANYTKEERGQRAKEHTAHMALNFGEEIKTCVRDTKVYSVDFDLKEYDKKYDKSKVTLLPMDSVTAVFGFPSDKTAVLNFASHKNPGGMFYEGSKAQEEGLCHESFLFNVLVTKEDYYKWNNENKNRALYVNRGLYSPNVRFIRDGHSTLCDVITCAAPNIGAASRWQNVQPAENTEVLKARIKFVLDIAADNGVDTLILGAFGCGVFKQDPLEVAQIFKDYLSTTHQGVFKQVVFPIPAGSNFDAFKKIFNR